MADIFICYRRDDSSGHAGRLYDRVAARFGAGRVFMDIDNMPPGVDFVNEVERILQTVRVVLVVIGPGWLPAERWSRSRLENADDYVRLEIIAALKRKKVKVVPVLVNGATIPSADRLPEEVRPLVRRHALDLRDSAWERDVTKLLDGIGRIVTPTHEGAPKPARNAGRAEEGRAPRPARKKRPTRQKSSQPPARKPGTSRAVAEQEPQPGQRKKKAPRNGGAQQKAAQQKPAQQKPAQKKPSQQKPGQQKPAQQKPGQQKPAQQKPGQQKPGQQKPAQQKPAQQKPAQQKPAQQKPAQQKPAQQKAARPKQKGALSAASTTGNSAGKKSGQTPQPARKSGSAGNKSAGKQPSSSRPPGTGAKRPAKSEAPRQGAVSNRKPGTPKSGGPGRPKAAGGGGAQPKAKKPGGGGGSARGISSAAGRRPPQGRRAR